MTFSDNDYIKTLTLLMGLRSGRSTLTGILEGVVTPLQVINLLYIMH